MIKRKVIFGISFVVFLSSVFVLRSGVTDSITAFLAVNQLSDDIVISSLSREQARSRQIGQFLNGAIALSFGGIIVSFVPKKKRRKKEC